jgi:hypothetical protein
LHLERQDPLEIGTSGVRFCQESPLVPVRELCGSGNPWRHTDYFYPTGIAQLNEVRGLWARPYEEHLAASHIPELRQFVDPGAPQQPAHAGDAGVAIAGNLGAGSPWIPAHRSNLVHREEPATAAHANGSEYGGAGRVGSHHQKDRQKPGRDGHERTKRDQALCQPP